jgi:hypothetical protein
MQLIEHIEQVICLVDRSAAPSEIKGALQAMYEEASGYDRAKVEQDTLNKQHAESMAALQTENAKLREQISQSKPPVVQFFTTPSRLRGSSL